MCMKKIVSLGVLLANLFFFCDDGRIYEEVFADTWFDIWEIGLTMMQKSNEG